jgi:hypothetical protein
MLSLLLSEKPASRINPFAAHLDLQPARTEAVVVTGIVHDGALLSVSTRPSRRVNAAQGRIPS